MRIVAGSLGGRIFASPGGNRTHPMSDKMRGALFNMLGDISNLTVLDAFAGSGALSFEAVSRGASQVIAIDRDRYAQRTIAENIESLQISDNMKLIKAPARSWLLTTKQQFDLVLLDPPYDSLQDQLLNDLAQRTVASGRLVLSWPGAERLPKLKNLELQTSKQYGDGSLHIFKRI